MLALFHEPTYDVLHLASGEAVQLPRTSEVGINELDAAVRYAFRSGLISHADFLQARDELTDDIQV